MSVLQGGRFGHGFISGFATQAASGHIGGLKHTHQRVMADAVLGCTVSATTGGNFANGAITGAFSRAFNDERHVRSKSSLIASDQSGADRVGIEENGNSVKITLRVKLVGTGVKAEVIGKFREGIEKHWSGKFGTKESEMHVEIVSKGDYFRIRVPEGDRRA